jgi:hypothetical protein
VNSDIESASQLAIGTFPWTLAADVGAYAVELAGAIAAARRRNEQLPVARRIFR